MASSAVEKKKNHQKSLRKELGVQFINLATSSFALVAALAWNQAIQDFVQQVIVPRVPGSGIFYKFTYAILITLIIVLVTYQLSIIATKLHLTEDDE